MTMLTTPDQTLLYTGDFKLKPGLTSGQAEIRQADILLTESTYGRPVFRFPDRSIIIEQLLQLVHRGFSGGMQPIVLGYSLGKAQEITRILSDAGFNVTCHGAVFRLNQVYDKFGVKLGSYRSYKPEDFHGPAELDLLERGVLVAPPQVARTAFVSRFPKSVTVMLSGWSVLKGANFRYGVDHCLPISDHADFEELLELIERVNPKKIYCHHGFPDFVDELKKRKHDARLARPPAQMMLFD